MNFLSDLLPSFLAAADPMAHVLDAPIFDYGFLEEDDRLYKVKESLWSLGLTKHVWLFFLAGILTLLFFTSYSSKIEKGGQRVPGRWGNFVETILEFLRDQMLRPFLGTDGDKYLPLISVIFVYILICNLLGLFPVFDYLGHGGNTSTANPAITPALALIAFVMYHALGVKEEFDHHHKESGNYFTAIGAYLKNQVPHVPFFVLPLIIVIELAAHIIRPCALAIRLCANMVAGHVMMASLLGFTAVFTKSFLISGFAISLMSFGAVTALTFLELLVALIQAFVFTFLTTVFLSMSVHPDH